MQSAGCSSRRAAFEQVGPLDPAFFVYSDEVDWQRRAPRCGLVGAVRAGGARSCTASSSRTGAGARRRIVEFARNRDPYVRKHHGPAAAAAVRVLTAWTYALRAVAALVLPGHSARRYAWHAYHSLLPGRGEGLREAAEDLNRSRRGSHVKSHTVYRTFETTGRREFVRITEDVQEAVDEAGVDGGHGARVGDAHHRRRVGQRRRARNPRGRARVARQAGAADLEASPPTTSAASCSRTPATTATTAAARTTATPTSRTCSCINRSCCRSPPASSTSAPGSRSSTRSSTAAGASGW